MRHLASRAAPRGASAGVTLIELMVALAIGSFLLIGAVSVFVQSRASYRVTESVSRLQENARFALDSLEPDLRMAHYWGLTSASGAIRNRAGPADPAAFAVGNDCGQNWSVHLDAAVDGSNNAYDWTCSANGGAQPGADTLVVRRVEVAPETSLQSGTLYVQTTRSDGGEIFLGDAGIPAGFSAATSATHRLVVNGYYVSPTSSLSTGGTLVPSLRVKRLTGGAAGPSVVDEEVLPGVEDMQIRFGVDTDPVGDPNRGAIDRYVDPGDAILAQPDVVVLAVRIWLRLRTERPETGFTDTNGYQYADRDVPPPGDGHRRIVVSKTIYVRNARPAA